MSKSHGMSGTRTHTSWVSMKTRCLNKNCKGYPSYGGRGISICDRWLNSFVSFMEDMGERPEGTSLDRYPDNNGNYEPSNCRWATSSQQSRNKRTSLVAVVGGEQTHLVDVAAQAGLGTGTLYSRVFKNPDLTFDVIAEDAVLRPGLRKQKNCDTGLWSKDGDDNEYIGRTYHGLTILRRSGVGAHGRLFLCSCVCGNHKTAILGQIVSGKTKSCGCMQREKAAETFRRINASRQNGGFNVG